MAVAAGVGKQSPVGWKVVPMNKPVRPGNVYVRIAA